MPFVPEEIVPYPPSVAEATHCRGTLLLASQHTLKARGHYERYLLALPSEHAEAITSTVANVWLPIELGVAHYRACDALGLSIDEQLAMGAAVVHDLQRTFIGTVLRAAGKEALSPIFGLQKFTTVYSRTVKGGGARVVRYGPKDARVEFMGLPLASVRYFRVAYRGFIQAGCEFFARRVVVAELDALASPTTCAYRIAWA